MIPYEKAMKEVNQADIFEGDFSPEVEEDPDTSVVPADLKSKKS